MKTSTVELLCNPFEGELMRQEGQELVGLVSGQRFPIRNGIPTFLDPGQQSFRTRWMRWFYDLTAPLYDPVIELGSRLGVGSEKAIRENVIAALPLKPGMRLLETSIGTASNAAYLPEGIDYFGQDLSANMLRRAQHKAASMGRDLELVQSDGASLPFRDETFDHVLNMGGLQFYGDPFQGVAEMARVLKPGGRATIIDQALPARNMLRRMPAHMEYAGTVAEAVVNMVRLVPFTMADYDSDWLPGGEFFKLEFSRPAVAGE